jgi:hypothetical protein
MVAGSRYPAISRRGSVAIARAIPTGYQAGMKSPAGISGSRQSRAVDRPVGPSSRLTIPSGPVNDPRLGFVTS